MIDLLGFQLWVVGIQAQVVLGRIDAAAHLLRNRPPDGLPPLADQRRDRSGVEEPPRVVGAKAEAAVLRLVSDDQLVVEEQVKLPMPSGDEAELADVVGEPLQNFARYPSGPEGMSSGHTVFDLDMQLLYAVAIDHIAPLFCLRISD